MFYVAQFEPDFTKSFTHVALNNLKALQTQNLNFEIRPLNHVVNWSSTPAWFTDDDVKYFQTSRPTSEQSAIVHLPPEDLLRTFYRDSKNAVGYTAFETSKLAPWICEGINASYKGLIVPSYFNKGVLERSGVRLPVRVVPHALPSMWLEDVPSPAEKRASQYIFGFVGNWNSRKGTTCIVDAYLKAFPEVSEDTALLIKTYRAGDVESYIRERAGSARPDVWVYDESWTESQLLWAFSMIDCYVSPHRSEGFGLCLAQHAALGKPTIYTEYSAPTEWLAEGHFPLPYHLVDIQADSEYAKAQIGHGAGFQWAEVSVDDLAEKLVYVREQCPRRGSPQETLAHFRKLVSWQNVGSELIHAVEDILDRKLERKEVVHEI